jgi:parallel beta-helix repeat protein
MGSEGAGNTTITCPGRMAHVLEAALAAEGINFVCTYTGDYPANVMDAKDAGVTLEHNECSDNGSSDYGGSGISVSGSAVCELIGSTCDSNGSCGIEAEGTVRVTITENLCRTNDACGVTIELFATGEITGNTRGSNGLDGIQASDGIHLVWCAACVARNNSCLFNDENGIEVYEMPATPEDNECSENGEAGIHFGPGSSGTAKDTSCTHNRWGIYVDETATPTIGTNDLHGNSVNPQLYDERLM